MSALGIFGGTFNPVHNGHMAVAGAAIKQFSLDRIMFLPNFQPPHKECTADSRLRLEMVTAAVSENEKYFVSDFEITKGGVSYSADTLNAFKKLYPNDDLYFIIGADSLRDFKKWYKPQEIVKNCKLIVYPRGNINIDECIKELKSDFGATIYTLDAPLIDISSSDIRNIIKSGKSADGFLPSDVLKIIKKNNLYKG